MIRWQKRMSWCAWDARTQARVGKARLGTAGEVFTNVSEGLVEYGFVHIEVVGLVVLLPNHEGPSFEGSRVPV